MQKKAEEVSGGVNVYFSSARALPLLLLSVLLLFSEGVSLKNVLLALRQHLSTAGGKSPSLCQKHRQPVRDWLAASRAFSASHMAAGLRTKGQRGCALLQRTTHTHTHMFLFLSLRPSATFPLASAQPRPQLDFLFLLA